MANATIDPRIGKLVRDGKEVFYINRPSTLAGETYTYQQEGSIEFLTADLKRDEVALATEAITNRNLGEADYVAERQAAEPQVFRSLFVNGYNEAKGRVAAEIKRKKHHAEVRRADLAISHKLVRTLLAAGFSITIDNGEEIEIKNSTDAKAIFKAMQLTDEDYVKAYRPASDANGKSISGWVRLIYGESGWDVICDNTENLEPWVGEGSATDKTRLYWEERLSR